MSDGVKKINEHLLKDGRTLVMTNYISDTSKLPDGTIYINPTTGELKYINVDESNNKAWTHFKISELFDKDSFDSSLIADNSLHAAKLVDLSIGTTKLAELSVTTNKIADESLTNNKFILNSIDADKIKDASIITSKIHDNSITANLISNEAVTTDKIAQKAITMEKIADGVIKTSHIIDKAITSNKILEGAIIHELVGVNAILSNNIGNKEVKNQHLDSLCITTDKIADGSIVGKKIPNYAIKDIHIDEMDGYKILDNTITSNKIKNCAIITNTIADNAVSITKLDSATRSLINNSIKIQPVLVIDNVERYSTALINGNVVLKSTDGTKTNLEVNGDIKATGDITGARVFNPYFADIAEAYYTKAPLLQGEAVALSETGHLRVEKLTRENASRFLGFVSNEYASLFGADKEAIQSGLMVAVCLIGRIKVQLPKDTTGVIGNYLNVDRCGDIYFTRTRSRFSVGKLLENKTDETTIALCQIWP